MFQLDRTRLAREKQLREEAVKEKEELERRMLQLQEEVRMAQDSLVPCDSVCMSAGCFIVYWARVDVCVCACMCVRECV